MNGYGTVDRVFRPLGIGTIDGKILFMSNAVKGGLESVIEGDKVEYRVFGEEIAGTKFARDVWRSSGR